MAAGPATEKVIPTNWAVRLALLANSSANNIVAETSVRRMTTRYWALSRVRMTKLNQNAATRVARTNAAASTKTAAPMLGGRSVVGALAIIMAALVGRWPGTGGGGPLVFRPPPAPIVVQATE